MAYQNNSEKNITNIYKLPIIKLGDDIPNAILESVERTSLEVLRLLEIPMINFTVSDPSKLIEMYDKNENNLFTYGRLPDSNLKIPVIVISTKPIYDNKMRESVALYNSSNAVIFINLRLLNLAFAGDANSIDQTTKIAIILVEEVIHFVQDKYWQRKFSNGTSDFADEKFAQQHDDDPIEREAIHIKKKIFKYLFPNLNLLVRGIDY